jgi:hypothetical protein
MVRYYEKLSCESRAGDRTAAIGAHGSSTFLSGAFAHSAKAADAALAPLGRRSGKPATLGGLGNVTEAQRLLSERRRPLWEKVCTHSIQEVARLRSFISKWLGDSARDRRTSVQAIVAMPTR